MRSALLPILLLSSTSALASPAPRVVEFTAASHGHAWANRTEQLAVLVTRADGRQHFLVVRARDGGTRRIEVPAPYRVVAFCWNSDDRGLVLSVAGPEPSATELRILSLVDGRVRKGFAAIAPIYAAIDDLAHAPGSTQWAAAYSGEGHPDVAAYEGEAEVLRTDVYPGVVSIAGWGPGVLFVRSNVDLSQGLSRDERSARGTPEEATEEQRLFAIDVGTQVARRATPAEAEGLRERSFDGRFEIGVQERLAGGADGELRVRLTIGSSSARGKTP